METLSGKKLPIDIENKKFERIFRKWKIKEVSVFGSVLRDDFDPKKSDIDFLVTFDQKARITLFDLAGFRNELVELSGREVDIVERRSIEKSRNWIKKEIILSQAEPFYVSK